MGALRRLDPAVLLIAAVAVLVGSYLGASSDLVDIDELLYRTTLHEMRDGAGFYDAFVEAIEQKSGVGPSEVRSVRTPVLSTVQAVFPPSAWRWLAVVPAFALVLAAAALAGPDVVASRIAAGIAGIWMVTSLPMLYLHHELWGAPLVVLAMAEIRRGRDGRAAALCLVATAIRELFGISILLGILLRRDRRPWLATLLPIAIGGALHAHWAGDVLSKDGFDPPLRAVEPYLVYVSPGEGTAALVLGAILLAAAVVGFWMRRRLADQRLAAAFTAILVVATALSGRSYWSLTWAGLASAAAGVALAELARILLPGRLAGLPT